MAADTTTDPIPSDVAEFIEFFEETLSDVRFPDVNRESLEALAKDVRDHAAKVDKLGEQMRAAREALEQAQGELRRAARRGLAYASVYADGDEALAERIAALSLSQESAGSAEPKSAPRQGKKRGRKPKDAKSGQNGEPSGAGELPFTGPQADLADDEAA